MSGGIANLPRPRLRTLIVHDTVPGVQKRGFTPDRVVHEGDAGDLSADDLTYVGKSLGVRRRVKSAWVKRVGIGVGMKVARHLVVNAEDVVNIWELCQVGSRGCSALYRIFRWRCRRTVEPPSGNVSELSTRSAVNFANLIDGVPVAGHGIFPAHSNFHKATISTSGVVSQHWMS